MCSFEQKTIVNINNDKCLLILPYNVWYIVLKYWNNNIIKHVQEYIDDSKFVLILQNVQWFCQDKSVEMIFTIISLLKLKLRLLDLSNVHINDNWFDLIIIANIVNLTPMRQLNLESCSVSTHAVIAIAAWLKNNTTVTNLNLNGNTICQWGVTALANAIAANTNLIILQLKNTMINKNGAIILANALKMNKTLMKIVLSDEIPINVFHDEYTVNLDLSS